MAYAISPGKSETHKGALIVLEVADDAVDARTRAATLSQNLEFALGVVPLRKGRRVVFATSASPVKPSDPVVRFQR